MSVVVPILGCPGTVSVWHVREGEAVVAGDRLVEVAIPGAVVSVAAPAGGRLTRRVARVGAAVAAGGRVGGD